MNISLYMCWNFWYKIVISTYCYVVDLLFIHNITTSWNNIKWVMTLKEFCIIYVFWTLIPFMDFVKLSFAWLWIYKITKISIYKHTTRHFFYSQKHVCTWTNTLKFHTHKKKTCTNILQVKVLEKKMPIDELTKWMLVATKFEHIFISPKIEKISNTLHLVAYK